MKTRQKLCKKNEKEKSTPARNAAPLATWVERKKLGGPGPLWGPGALPKALWGTMEHARKPPSFNNLWHSTCTFTTESGLLPATLPALLTEMAT